MKYLLAILLLPLCVNAQLGFVDQSGASVGVADWRTSLVGYWPLDSLNRGLAQDLSSYANVGTNINGAMLTNGIIGSCSYFLFVAGAQNYTTAPYFVTSATKAIIPTTTNVSFSCWAYPNNDANGADIVALSNGVLFSPSYHNVAIGRDTVGRLFFNNYDGSEHRAVSNLAYTNVWTHIVGVRLNGTNFIYVNGALQTTTSVCGTTSVSASANLRIGGGVYHGFQGMSDDVRIYNRALTSNEISAIYRWGWGTHQGTPTHP